MLTLADNETKQPIIESQSAKSEEKKLRVHKAKKELPLVKTESQPSEGNMPRGNNKVIIYIHIS